MVASRGSSGSYLAGGEGKRLWPLTADRAKPAVPFGGNFRLIDFVLSNLVNAGYLRDLRADPVQVALARPTHHHDLADEPDDSATTSHRFRRSSGWARGGTPAVRTPSTSR